MDDAGTQHSDDLHHFTLLSPLMNKSFRSIWNSAIGAWVAVSELCRSKGKNTSTVVLSTVLPMLLCGISLPAHAQITTTGYVSPGPATNPNWTVAGGLVVGATNTAGTLNIQAGSKLFVGNGFNAGLASGSVASIDVSGLGSSLNNGGWMVLGGSGGAATLTLTNGANAGVGGLFTGWAGGSGSVVVDGPGTQLTENGQFFSVGGNGTANGGTGSVIVRNGGTVNTSDLNVGTSRLSAGTVTVTGPGSTWNYAGNGNIGSQGAANVTVADGGVMNLGQSWLGGAWWDATSTTGNANVLVTGSGAAIKNTSTVVVGYWGSGNLTVENGGALTSKSEAPPFGAAQGSQIGYGAVSTGVLKVTGAGSSWSDTGAMTVAVGGSGHGTLSITDSGLVTVAAPLTLALNSGSVGTLNIGAAAGSTALAAGTLNAPSVVFGAGTGTVNFNHTSTDGSYAFAPAISSNSGRGTINQLAGTTNLTGDSSGFGGTTNVSAGVLNVTGKLGNSSSALNVSNGTFSATSGATISTNVTSLAAMSGNSLVVVNGPGSTLSQNRLNIGVAGSGTATVNVSNGGKLFSNDIYMGVGGDGSLAVSGVGSTLNQQSGNFGVGQSYGNTGSVRVDAGGTINSTDMNIGQFGTGNVLITGAGSSWTLHANENIGSYNVGNVIVADGGLLSGARGNVGGAIYDASATTANGSVTVTGAGSTWTNTSTLIVGVHATGALNVLDGGTVTSVSEPLWYGTTGDGIGYYAGSHGTISVSGAGSKWTDTGSSAVFIGAAGTGTLNIASGGVVSTSAAMVVAQSASAAGTINIGAATGSTAVAPGTLNTPSIAMGAGTSVLNLNHTTTDSSYTFAPAISSSTGSATINQLAGNTNLTGNSNAFGGVTNVTGGTLRVNGTLGNAASTLNVSNGGTLGGAGTIGGSVTIGNGVLAPGNSPGTLTIAGNLALNSTSQLNYELGAANTVGGALNDLTNVGGNLTLAGTLNVTQSAGGTYGAGIYRLINYSGALTNNGLTLGNMPAGTANYVQTSVANQVNLVNSNGLTLSWWDGDSGIKNNIINGGNGTWLSGTAGTDRWTQADGLINAPYQNPSFAIFSGASGTVTVDNSLGRVAVTGMQLSTNGYRIQGGDIALTAGTDAIRVGDGTAAGAATTATIASNLIGAGRLDKVDVGTLVLAGNNTYSGGTAISGGSLQLGNGGTTGAIIGDVLNNSTFAINRANAVSLSGAISGSGQFIQLGTGTTTLGNANTYAGGTTISAGTLIGSATSFGTGAIANNAALVINQATDASFANALNGTGSFLKTGAGRLNLTGTGTLSGPTTVGAGTLSVNGSLANSAVIVNSGGTLGGNGTVGAVSVLASGTVAPGNSIGTLNVNGNYTQAAGSTYQVEVNPGSSASDRIVASGSATIGAGALLNVTQNPAGLYSLGTKYTVLTATNGVTGQYGLTGMTRTAFVQLYGSYDANNAYLTAQQSRSFAAGGLTRNQIATGSGLDTLPAGNALANAVAWLPSDAAAQNALNQLSGEIHASVKTAMLEDSRFVRDAANDRLLGTLCAPGTDTVATGNVNGSQVTTGVSCAAPGENSAWGRIYGSKGRVAGDGNASELTRDIGGILVGADTVLASGWRVGGLAGSSRSTFEVAAAGSTASSKDYQVGVYGGNRWDDTSVRVGASYSWSKVDTQRNVAFAGLANNVRARYDAATSQVFGEMGQRMAVNNVALEPFAGLAHVTVKTNGFSEAGGLAALHSGGDSTDVTFSTLGVRASTQLNGTTHLRGMAGWRHAFGNMTASSSQSFAGSSAFTVYGVPLASNVAVLEAGIETRLQPNLTLGVSYSGQFGHGVRDNGLKVNLGWAF